jgi:hypothetical protein
LGTDLANVPQIATCDGTQHTPVGIAGYDIASGALGPVKSGCGRHVTATAGAAIVAGVKLMADATGKVVTYVGPVTTTTVALPSFPDVIGVAVTAAAADGNDIEVRLWI